MESLGPYKLNTIVTGDARELAKAIPDESVDLIFTDPVYQNIDDYRWLAETAAQILKTGGSVLAQCGISWRFEAEIGMAQSGLVHNPLLFDYYEFSKSYYFSHRMSINLKHYLWFSRGRALTNTVFQVCKAYKAMGRGRNGRPSFKRFFKWGDSEAYLTQRVKSFTNPSGIVLDPFTGGGTVPAVCKMLGRQYLAFEIDPDRAELARQRVANTQPPLFVPQVAQLEMVTV